MKPTCRQCGSTRKVSLARICVKCNAPMRLNRSAAAKKEQARRSEEREPTEEELEQTIAEQSKRLPKWFHESYAKGDGEPPASEVEARPKWFVVLGPKEALEKYGATDAEQKAFAAGFVSGQAEKVYLGACRAAMFRPSQEKAGWMLEIVEDVCFRYGLSFYSPVGSKQEVWICRIWWAGDVMDLRDMKEDSAAWHEKRAWLCGIPDAEVDREFHLRSGHGAKCD